MPGLGKPWAGQCQRCWAPANNRGEPWGAAFGGGVAVMHGILVGNTEVMGVQLSKGAEGKLSHKDRREGRSVSKLLSEKESTLHLCSASAQGLGRAAVSHAVCAPLTGPGVQLWGVNGRSAGQSHCQGGHVLCHPTWPRRTTGARVPKAGTGIGLWRQGSVSRQHISSCWVDTCPRKPTGSPGFVTESGWESKSNISLAQGWWPCPTFL